MKFLAHAYGIGTRPPFPSPRSGYEASFQECLLVQIFVNSSWLSYRHPRAPRSTLAYKYLNPHHPAPKGLVAHLVEHHTGVVKVPKFWNFIFQDKSQDMYTSLIIWWSVRRRASNWKRQHVIPIINHIGTKKHSRIPSSPPTCFQGLYW